MTFLWVLTIFITLAIACIWKFCNDFLPKIVSEILLILIATLLSSACIFYDLHEDMHVFTLEHILIFFSMFICVLGLSYLEYETINVFDNSIE